MNEKLDMSGSFVALVTPFTEDGRVDYEALRRLVEFHVVSGTSGIVPCGTTGESPTLSVEEHSSVIKAVVAMAAGRIKVVAGTGSNNTDEAIALTRFAEDVGADGALIVCPYYNKPSQEGIYRHYKKISVDVEIPIVIYSIVGRCGVNIEPETVANLAVLGNIVGIKEASGNIDQMSRIVEMTPDDFQLISGDDSLTLPIMSIGGVGVISVLANVLPKEVATLVKLYEGGNGAEARALHHRLLPLIKALFIESNPAPVKTAMGFMKMIRPDLRLPLCEMSAANTAKLRTVMVDAGLIRA